MSRKKENDGPIYTPNGVHAFLQRVNGNAPPTITRIRKAPGTNLMFRACDAVPWKLSAQREAERVRRGDDEKKRKRRERKKKKKEEDKKKRRKKKTFFQRKKKEKSIYP